MKKYLETRKIFLGIVLVELLIFVWGYFSEPNINEAFRISARYSARFSAIMYLLTFNFFIFQANNEIEKRNLSRFMLAFAVVHFIHLIFLACNVFLNNIELIPYKLAGGFLAYLMILLFPFFCQQALAIKMELLCLFLLCRNCIHYHLFIENKRTVRGCFSFNFSSFRAYRRVSFVYIVSVSAL